MSEFDTMKNRYEQLKKMYFHGSFSERDEEGQELPTLFTRVQIVQMFENMGVELPLSPSDPIKFKR